MPPPSVNMKGDDMAYVTYNFKTKKALKAALAAGQYLNVYQPGRNGLIIDGTVYIEGPHYPAAPTWCAEGKVIRGKLVAVR